MIKITSFATTIYLFFTAALQGQTCCTCSPVDDFEGHNWYNVSAPSGLILRADPSRSAKKLDAIPFGEQVLGCRSTSVEETIEGKSGRWIKVNWAEKSGYLFGGFLTETTVPNIRMVIPNAGIDSGWGCMEFPPEISWQGLVNADTTKNNPPAKRLTDFLAVNLKMGRKKVSTDCQPSGVLDNTVLNELPAPFAVFSGFKLAKNVHNYVSAPVKLLPGTVESFRFYDPATQITRDYIISADGHVISNPDFVRGEDNRKGPNDRIEQYRVRLYEQTFQGAQSDNMRPWKSQKLEESTVTSPSDAFTYEMGVLYIYFAGDLDGDQHLDLILAHLDGVGSSFTLFLSSKKLPSFLLRCVASFRDTAC